MGNVERTPLKILQKIGLLGVAEFGEATVSTNDTVTFDTMTTLSESAFIRLDTATLITSTEATNVATITQAGVVEERCLYLVVGER